MTDYDPNDYFDVPEGAPDVPFDDELVYALFLIEQGRLRAAFDSMFVRRSEMLLKLADELETQAEDDEAGERGVGDMTEEYQTATILCDGAEIRVHSFLLDVRYEVWEGFSATLTIDGTLFGEALGMTFPFRIEANDGVVIDRSFTCISARRYKKSDTTLASETVWTLATEDRT